MKSVHSSSMFRRYLAVIVVTAIGVTLSAAAFLWERQQEQGRLAQRFEFRAKERSAQLQAAIDRAIESLLATGAFFDASIDVTRKEFELYLREHVTLHPDIHGIEWLPRVRDSEREAFEAAARAEGLTDFHFTETSADGALTRAEHRAEYFPVFYIAPLERNRKALGYDSYSRINNRPTMDLARDTGRISATDPFVLVQDTEQALTTILYRPVYGQDVNPSTIEERRVNLTGFVVVLLRIPDLAKQALANLGEAGLDWILFDASLPAGEQLLHIHTTAKPSERQTRPRLDNVADAMSTTLPVNLPGRQWRIQFFPGDAFLAQAGTTRAWLILATALLTTTVLALYIGSRIRRTEEIERFARRDYLTGLPNRALLLERLDHALTMAQREGRQLALLFLDLDRFKHVNDSLGHSSGDRLLIEVSERLSQVLRMEDTLARMGGDEFVILMEHLPQVKDAAVLADKLIQSLAKPIGIGDMPLFMTTSIGISLYPRDAQTTEELISSADAAMYRAKDSGRNTYQFYTPELTELAHEQVRLAGELKHALENRELELHYQPLIHLAEGRIFGVEALLRWRKSETTLLPPDRFIPMAEDTGLIILIGAWVIREACAQVRRWLDDGLPLERISINIAGPQLLRGEIVATVREALATTRLPAGMLELEITESFIMGKTLAAVRVLKDLRHLGVTIAVDDFGTGYSSLSRLKRLPIDRLKIDKSFVQDLPFDEDDSAIARAVIALGQNLGLSVIAEGVENAAQAEFLFKEGCDEAQGFHYSRPVPAKAVPDLLSDNRQFGNRVG